IVQIYLWIIDSGCSKHMTDGVDLLTDDRSSNLYTIALNKVASNSLTSLLAKASSSESWLWHQRLSHLNFATINNLVKNNLVQGLPKMKFEKDHLCSACEQGKIHQKHHKSKTSFASNKHLYLLHKDLCGLIRVQSINGKRYVLVVVDDYSRYTWRVRTDNGTEFKNITLAKFFDMVGITQQFSAARTPQQNGVVERKNRTLVEAARTMLTFANLPSSESENQTENDCLVVENERDKEENPKVIAPGMFKLNVSQCVSQISMSKSSYLDTVSSVRRPNNSGVIWKKKGSSNTFNVGLSTVNVLNLNKNVKRYSRKDLLACNNSHLGEASSAYMCNDAMNVSCDSRMNDLLDDNNFFIFDDVNVRISPVSKMPFRKKPRNSIHIVQICLWIIDLGCSKHMTGNRALLTNFVEKFLGMVRFGNNDFAVTAGYGDVGLEVAFQKSTCFVRNEDGVDLLTGDLSSNLYTIALNEVASNSSTCLLAKASSLQSWLWHQHLSHLNFATVNNLVKNNLVQGLPKMKFKNIIYVLRVNKGRFIGNITCPKWILLQTSLFTFFTWICVD
nr:hypothetical protein [Tanacetum cinerariifolium]